MGGSGGGVSTLTRGQADSGRSQAMVAGQVRLKLYKGNASIIGRTSPYARYDQDLVTFEAGKVAYDHRETAGLIKLNALRLCVVAKRDRAPDKVAD